MRLQPAVGPAVGARALQRFRIRRVGIDVHRRVAGARRLARQRARLFERRREFAGLDLARLDIGLVERVDPDHGAGDRDGELEADELLADLVRRFQHEPRDRVSGLLQCIERACVRRIGFAAGPQIDEEAVAAVDIRRAERLAIDRNKSVAVLAGRLGDQLLGPGAEIRNFRRREQRDLVAAGPPGDGERDTELDGGICFRRHSRPARPCHHLGGAEQESHVDPGGRGGHQAERREHRIAAADAGIAQEDAAEPLGPGGLLQRRARIGNGDEAAAGLLLAERLDRTRPGNNP